jgi:hypothetical protein
MKDKMVFSRSSLLVSIPVLLVGLLVCVLSAFFGMWNLSMMLMFLVLLAGIARIWAFSSSNSVSIRVISGEMGLFPGDSTQVQMEIRNEKFLPVVWLELFFPLAQNLCITPEEQRTPDDWELPNLEEEEASTKMVGEKRLSMFWWYESRHFSICWTANRRGVYSMEGWRLRTGDGFGLCQVERGIPREDVRTFSVYPKLVDVTPDLFLRNLWNADTGTKGVMEDTTVIRATRDYMTSDPLKHINWRLTARGLPMTVNVYEDILPKSVHFLFDGESFSGPNPHLEEMEEALSILGSELVRLEQVQVQCGLSLCQGSGRAAINLFAPVGTVELLGALAAYQPMPPKWDDENKVMPQSPVFDEGAVLEQFQRVGRFYYIAYNTDSLKERKFLRRLGQTSATVLTYEEAEPFGEFELVCLRHLREGNRNE